MRSTKSGGKGFFPLGVFKTATQDDVDELDRLRKRLATPKTYNNLSDDQFKDISMLDFKILSKT